MELFNTSGRNHSRFAPVRHDGSVVPTVYVARRAAVALLETAFKDVHLTGLRRVSEMADLAPRVIVRLTAPVPITLFDLTDGGLAALGLERTQLISATPAHSACTQEWAGVLCGRKIGRAKPQGIAWHSRVAELASGDDPLLEDLLADPANLVVLLFGDGLPMEAAPWQPEVVYDDLVSGDGRMFVERLATLLDAVVLPA